MDTELGLADNDIKIVIVMHFICSKSSVKGWKIFLKDSNQASRNENYSV